MTAGPIPRIRFGIPDTEGMKSEGYTLADMHVHTDHSDAAPSVRQILHHTREMGIGIAITDHNGIRGVKEILEYGPESLVIPGIEIDCAEGPHILLYFYTFRDLLDFFDRHIRHRRIGTQYAKSALPAGQILDLSEGYPCLKVAAHPFGYFCLNRGILKAESNHVLSGIVPRLDAIEVICGGMTPGVNRMAIEYAQAHRTAVTGGSDAHILNEIGSVVTGVRADTVGDFLDGIRKGTGVVAGTSSGIASRLVTGSVIAYHYIPYTVTCLHTRIGMHADRLRCSVRRIFREP